MSQLPEPLRRRAEELAARSPEEVVQHVLAAYVEDAETLDEVRLRMRLSMAPSTLRQRRQELEALDLVLASEPWDDFYAWLKEYYRPADAYPDPTSEAFLRQIADLLREVIDEAEAARRR